MAVSIFEVADWFLHKEAMPHKKLQKLCYYYFAWGHALLNRNVIDNCQFQAWVHGPVNVELYDKYRDFGWVTIPKKEEDNTNLFVEEELGLLESVWCTYGEKSGNELEALTHDEPPWKTARKGRAPFERSQKVIDPKNMKKYYKSIYIGD